MIFFAIFLFICTCYILGVITCFLIGAVIALESADYGKDDIDYRKGKMLMQYAIIWPFGISIILRRLEGD